MTNENTVNVKTLKRCFIEKIDIETGDTVDTVEDGIQKAIFNAIDCIVAPKIQLAIRSKNTSSGQDATSVTANSEPGEHVGIKVFSKNASGDNNVVYVSKINDETRNNIPDEVSEFSVPETRFDPSNTHSSHSDRLNNPNKSNR